MAKVDDLQKRLEKKHFANLTVSRDKLDLMFELSDSYASIGSTSTRDHNEHIEAYYERLVPLVKP